MKFSTSVLFICLAAYVFVGCQPTPLANESTANLGAKPKKAEPAESNLSEQQDDEQPSRADRLLNKAGDIFKKATESTADGKSVSKEWILEKIQEATGSDPDSIGEDASEWAKKMYKNLKDKGMTGAGDAREWLTEDIRNMNAFKYKVIKVSLDDLEALEDQLNHFGQLKWECFHVTERGGETVMFFKKERRSLLKNVPVKDMMNLIPLMGSE